MVQRCQRTTNVNPKSRNTLNETVDDMSLSFIVEYSVPLGINCKIIKNADIGNMQVCIGCFVFIKIMYGISLRTVLFLHTSFVVSLMIINCMHKWLS